MEGTGVSIDTGHEREQRERVPGRPAVPARRDYSTVAVVAAIVALLLGVAWAGSTLTDEDQPIPETSVTLATVAQRCGVPQTDPARIVLDRRLAAADGTRMAYTEEYSCVLQSIGAGDLYGEILSTVMGSRTVAGFFIDWHVPHSTGWHVVTVTNALGPLV